MSTLDGQLAGDASEQSAGRHWRPTTKHAVAALAFAAVTVVTYLVAHPRMFSFFAAYDDEGVILTWLDSFLRHGNLYDEVFSQYGPFYFEAWGALFSIFGIPVTHDGGRSVTLAVWVISSLTIGLAAARMTGSYLLGLATQMLVFASLGALPNEPMHPGGIIVLLLAAIVAISCAVGATVSVGAMALLGGAVAGLILVKINVGIFALAAVSLACAVSYAPLASRRWLRPLVEIGFVAIPLVLMASEFSEGWVREYAVHGAVAALAVVIALRARESPPRPSEELWWLLWTLLGVALMSCLGILVMGTSPGGLVEGVVRQPLRQADAFSSPFVMADGVFVFDAIALTGAVAYWYARVSTRRSVWTGAVSLLTILIGIEMALSPIGKTLTFDLTSLDGYQLSLLSFAWVGLIPRPGESRAAAAFARLLLPLLAVLQGLHAFPVAGSQLAWSSFLLVPVGAVCVANGVAGLARRIGDEPARQRLAAAGAVGAVILIAFVVNVTLREPLNEARAAYDSRVPLDLPGARGVRLDPMDVARYRRVTEAIDDKCGSFVMLPGMASFYVWTEQEPPTEYNATHWPTLFDDARQRRVIEDIDSAPGLCLLENKPLALNWGAGTIAKGPLVRYMRREFSPILSVGDYCLLRHAPSTQKSGESPTCAEESEERSGRVDKEPTAGEVATYLNRRFDYSRLRASNDRPEKIRVRVYASQRQLREAQRFLDKALGRFQPTAVICGVIRVEVDADDSPDAQAIEQEHAGELKRALSAEYDC
jgi:hypothetical protein